MLASHAAATVSHAHPGGRSRPHGAATRQARAAGARPRSRADADGRADARDPARRRPRGTWRISATGVTETVRLLPCPLTLRPDQFGYTHYISQTLLNCLKRLPDLYFAGAARCARFCASRRSRRSGCASAGRRRIAKRIRSSRRLDAVVDYTTADVEGLDQVHGAEPERHRRPAHGADGDAASSPISSCRRSWPQDPEHPAPARRRHPRAAAAGAARASRGDRPRATGRSCSSIPSTRRRGPTSRRRSPRTTASITGCSVLHADASELRLRGDEVWYGDTRVDLVYRDASVLDLIGYGAGTAWTSRRCARCSGRTASCRRSPRSSIRRAASRCSPIPSWPSGF